MSIFFWLICKPVDVLVMLLLMIAFQFTVLVETVFHLQFQHVVQPVLCAWHFNLLLSEILEHDFLLLLFRQVINTVLLEYTLFGLGRYRVRIQHCLYYLRTRLILDYSLRTEFFKLLSV